MCYASPEYLARHPISHPDEYAAHILGGNTQFITNQQFRSVKTGQTISMPLNFQLMSDNTNVLLEWAAAGDGILMSCPYTAGLDYVRRGALAVVLPEWRLPNNHVYAYAAKKDMTSPETPLSVFLDILQSASDTMKTASDLFYDGAGRSGAVETAPPKLPAACGFRTA